VCKVDSKAPGIRSLGFRVPTVCKVDSKAPGIRSLGFRVPTVCKVGSKAPGIRSYTSIFRFKDGLKSSIFRVRDQGSRYCDLRSTVLEYSLCLLYPTEDSLCFTADGR
jgi:hypothetical protein